MAISPGGEVKPAIIDGESGRLSDLSAGGAQVLCAKQPDVSRLVNLSLLSDDAHVTCEGRIVWAWVLTIPLSAFIAAVTYRLIALLVQ